MVKRILRPPVVVVVRGTSRSGLYADVARGLYTPPIKLSARASGWPESEVEALQAATIAGKSPDEIRQLVRQLVAKRTAGGAE